MSEFKNFDINDYLDGSVSFKNETLILSVIVLL